MRTDEVRTSSEFNWSSSLHLSPFEPTELRIGQDTSDIYVTGSHINGFENREDFDSVWDERSECWKRMIERIEVRMIDCLSKRREQVH